MVCISCEQAKEEIERQVISKVMPLIFSLYTGTKEDFNNSINTLYENNENLYENNLKPSSSKSCRT